MTVPVPIFAAQAATPVDDASTLVATALRRWFASLTLSSSGAEPSLAGFWWALAGLALLLGLALVAQGPGRALLQLVDLPGHFRLARESVGRLRRSGRMVSVLIGALVLSWTADQAISYNNDRGRAELGVLMRTRSLPELALEQGAFAGLTPARDVFALGDVLPLLVVAVVLLFQATNDPAVAAGLTDRGTVWGTACWGGGALYVLYRLAALVAGATDFPLGGCAFPEAAVVPALMALADALLLAWVLVELRTAGLGDTTGEPVDPLAPVALMPAALVACLAAMPARYLAAGAWLSRPYVDAAIGKGTPASLALGWQLGPGLLAWQGLALALIGLAGAAAWTRGGLRAALAGYGRMLRAEGGRVVAVLAGAFVAAGALAAAAYAAVLSLPPQPWTLSAADGYAHYATLPVGLMVASALVELGGRALPEAARADVDATPPG